MITKGEDGFGAWSNEKETSFFQKFPLHHACRDGKSEVLRELLLQLQNNISNSHHLLAEDDYYGWTAAHFAVYFGHVSFFLSCNPWIACDMRFLTFFQSLG